jgi:hypothetical protein
MRRKIVILATAAGIAIGGSVATAGAAAAAPPAVNPGAALNHANVKSAHFYCGPLIASEHPGQHEGWVEASGERRNVGGNCGPV